MLYPVSPCDDNKYTGERDTNYVMSQPADRTFRMFGWRRGNIDVPESSFWHGEKPTPDETDIGRDNLKGMFEKQPPKIKRECGPKSYEDGVNEEKREIIHHLILDPADL